jgi:polyhydroxyalkanoate synthesis repressor PhaR
MTERKTIIIKKYENRRLYDATNSRYINLDEIARLVKAGREVQVVDAATGDDITRVVLTQIIMEDAKEPGSTFPLDILRQMVIASGRATQESALQYMKTMFDMYQNAYRAMAPPLSQFDFMRSGPRQSAGPPTQTSAAEAPGAEVDELKQRVAELESLVSRVGAVKKPRKRASRAPRKRRTT